METIAGTDGSFLDLSDIQREEEVESPAKGPTISTPNKQSCSECGVLTSMKNHKRHMLLHKSDLKCKKCSIICTDKAALQKHMRTHDDTMDVCNHCGKTFNRKSGVIEHIRVLHENVKKYKCNVKSCIKTFSRLVHLQDHLNTHSNRRPYKCKCEKAYTSQYALSKHEKDCSDLVDHQCSHCLNRFSSSTTLRDHVASMHDGQRFSCACGNVFKWRSNLCRHQKSCPEALPPKGN